MTRRGFKLYLIGAACVIVVVCFGLLFVPQ
nr:hypothetical protein REQ54_01730 [Rhizobium sp. Q54]